MNHIAQCIDYIEENLNDTLSVESVAVASGYSRHYFQRLFSRSMGVTLGTYIHGRRMTRAAMELGTTDKRVIEIAQDAGFESQEAFTRAFKDYFGKPPAQYRSDKSLPILKPFPAFDKDLIHHLTHHAELFSPRFIDRDSFCLAALGGSFKRNDTRAIAADLWPTFMRRRSEIQGVKDKMNYGVLKSGGSADGPDFEEFVYCTAAEITPGTSVPPGFESLEIKAQHYAVFEHLGRMSTLPLTNRYIWGVWATQREQIIADSPDLEVYPVDFLPKTQERMELWIPLVKA